MQLSVVAVAPLHWHCIGSVGSFAFLSISLAGVGPSVAG